MDHSDLKMVGSPHADVAKNEVLVIQEANTKIKEIIVEGITYNHPKELVQQKLNKTIAKYVAQVPTVRQDRVRRSLIQNAQKDYFLLSQNISTINRNMANKINSNANGFSINIFENTNSIITENKLRGYVTDERKGSAVIKDYRKQVRSVIKSLTVDSPEIQLNDVNNKPYKMSARNYAEMSVRYEANLNDIKNLKNKNVKLVWTSSHSDASPRCQPYQGKLYSLDGTSGTTEDGISYTPLDKALLGPKGDGNGIINGYNCRHYLIEYMPGSKPPVEYDRNSVLKENKINTKQRNFENNIRQLKLQERLAKKSGDKELAKRLNKKWKILELEYHKFSLKNDRAYFPWRCAISRNETVNRTKWGDQQTNTLREEIKVEIEQKYGNKIVKDPSTNLVTCNFETDEELENYKDANNINFGIAKPPKRLKSKEEIIKYENDRISSVINLRENLHDIELPKEYCNKLNFSTAKIVISESNYNENGKYKDGTAVHISKQHSEIGNSITHINNIMNLFKSPNGLRVFKVNNLEDKYPRYILANKYDENNVYFAIADNKVPNELELFNVYIKPIKEIETELNKNKMFELL